MQRKSRAPMQTYTAGEPLERMAIDVMGELHLSKSRNKCVVVAMDYFTKFVFLLPLPNHKAKTIAEALVKEVFTKFGIPKFLHSDRGTDFMSNLFRETCNLFRIDKTLTTPWRPQSDGMVERMNRTLGAMLRQYTSENQDDWDEYLPYCALAYNSSYHSSTSYSPNFLMFGREFRVPLELVLPVPDEDLAMKTGENSVDHVVRKMQIAMQLAYGVTRDKLQSSAVMQKHYYDRKAKPNQWTAGQSVWLYNPRRRKGRTPKLDKPWEGPFAIVKVFSNVLCMIQRNRRSKPKVVHVDKLCLTRRPVDTDWVFKLPKRTHEVTPTEVFEGLPRLFDESPVALKKRSELTLQDVQGQQMSQEDFTSSGADSQNPDVAQDDPLQKQTRSGKSYFVE